MKTAVTVSNQRRRLPHWRLPHWSLAHWPLAHWMFRSLVLSLALLGSACVSLSDAQRDRAASIAHAARSQVIDCSGPDACAQASPLHDLGPRAFAHSTPQ
ncbi:MAG: hypothetical protein ABI858_00745, partial [Pseudoxanthomonas sp.]